MEIIVIATYPSYVVALDVFLRAIYRNIFHNNIRSRFIDVTFTRWSDI